MAGSEAHGHIIVESNTEVANSGATFKLLFPVWNNID
jgi:hypothetical protein